MADGVSGFHAGAGGGVVLFQYDANSICLSLRDLLGAHNYTDLLHDQLFWQATWNTFYYTLMALPAGLLVSLGVALLLNVEMPGRAIWRTIIFMPSLVPIVSSAIDLDVAAQSAVGLD